MLRPAKQRKSPAIIRYGYSYRRNEPQSALVAPAERLRDELAARLAAVVEGSEDAIITKTLDGVITTWNPAAQRVFGYAAAEAIGRSMYFLIPTERHDEESRILERLRRGERVEAFETVRITKDHRRIIVSVAVSPIRDASGRIIGASKIARDITEQKKAEAEVARLSAAEAANLAKDDFLAAVSHDLRTPIGAVMLLVEVLKRTQLNEKQRRAVGQIEVSARTQSRLIEDILDSARIRHGTLVVEKHPLNLMLPVRAAMTAVEPIAREHGVGIIVAADQDESVMTVLGDELRLEQVCWNLLTNAIKFSPRGAEVQLRIGGNELNVWIEVKDRGRGIAPEFVPRVFERLSQELIATGARQSGLGLGLSIVRHIVELHGGTVRAESDGLGLGATFTVTLPRPGEEFASSRPLPSLAGIRVLVVEDDTETQESLTVLLGLCGARIRSARSVEEGWAIFREWGPQVLISDNTPPGADGLSLIAKIRSLPEEQGGNVRAVALAGQVRDADDELTASGFDLYFTKPADPTELLTAVARLSGPAESSIKENGAP